MGGSPLKTTQSAAAETAPEATTTTGDEAAENEEAESALAGPQPGCKIRWATDRIIRIFA